jgi:hypothetical protein
MWIAMKDLEIRGAGNLLGGEQSGHIAAVGFDLYVRLVGEAVADFKGEGAEAARTSRSSCRSTPTCRTTTSRASGSGWRPTASSRRRRSEEDLEAVRAELDDRYGEPPTPVTNLLEVARFRVLARRAGLAEVALAGNSIRFAPVELPRAPSSGCSGSTRHPRQARSPYDPGAEAHDRPGRWAAAARRRAPALVPRPRLAVLLPELARRTPMTRLTRTAAALAIALVAPPGCPAARTRRLGSRRGRRRQRISTDELQKSTRDYLKIVPGADPAQVQRDVLQRLILAEVIDKVARKRRGSQRRPGSRPRGTTCSRAPAAGRA